MGTGQKVVIDTNVFISAFGWGGKPLEVVELLEKGEIRNGVSEETLNELIIAISYPKLAFSRKTQSAILEFVLAYSDMYEPQERFAVASDPEDNKIIECAAASNAKVIITGDKGLLSLNHYREINILTPEDFLKTRRG
jgi:putative PIN family toxin of toxin-antitoxin system